MAHEREDKYGPLIMSAGFLLPLACWVGAADLDDPEGMWFLVMGLVLVGGLFVVLPVAVAWGVCSTPIERLAIILGLLLVLAGGFALGRGGLGVMVVQWVMGGFMVGIVVCLLAIPVLLLWSTPSRSDKEPTDIEVYVVILGLLACAVGLLAFVLAFVVGLFVEDPQGIMGWGLRVGPLVGVAGYSGLLTVGFYRCIYRWWQYLTREE